MKNFKVIELAKAGKARLFGNANAAINGAVIDSREAKDGLMFVCIKGEKNDGHDYVMSAYDLGCRVFLMSNIDRVTELMQAHEDATVVFVNDTELAFQRMAAYYLKLIRVKKIAVTGSVGKTTTKSLTAAILSKKYKTITSEKNYNTSLGMCMTIFRANMDTEVIVFEMGMDKSGEIDGYCSWIRPDTAIITVIGDSHLERLGSKEAIADAKLEITHYLENGDALIYNSDSPFLDFYSLKRRTKMNFIPIPVGCRDEASVHVNNIIDKGLGGISFDLCLKDESIAIDLPILGKHNAINAALAATCGMLYDVPNELIALALSQVSGTDRRLAFEDINGLLLLDDSYNANPASMAAALDVLAGIEAKRHIAILADMYELGEDEEQGHIQTGVKAAETGVDLLISIGKNSGLMAQGAMSKSDKTSVIRFYDVESSLEKIMTLIGPGDAVLVKGSNATKVSTVAELIRNLKN